MQGKLIIGALFVTAFGAVPAMAGEPVKRQTCQKGEPPQQVQQQRQQVANQQQAKVKPQGCPITRMIPSVVDPTPTFLL